MDYSQLRRETKIIFVCCLHLLLNTLFLQLYLILISDFKPCLESELAGSKVKSCFWHTQFNPLLAYFSHLHTSITKNNQSNPTSNLILSMNSTLNQPNNPQFQRFTHIPKLNPRCKIQQLTIQYMKTV